MITSDIERTARAVADRLGIDPEHVTAEVLPEEKADAVEALPSENRETTMVGDYVTDAPTLAAAFLRSAIGSGTAVAHGAADVTLMRSDPLDVLEAVRISAGTLAKIKQTLFSALDYTTAMIAPASIGVLQPVLAAVAMATASVSVLTNNPLFRRYDPETEYQRRGFLRP